MRTWGRMFSNRIRAEGKLSKDINLSAGAISDEQSDEEEMVLKDTIKELKGGKLISTPPRDHLAAVQTPQVFQADLIRAALAEAAAKDLSITDDCSAVEAMGIPIQAVDGWEENIKITTPLDVVIAEEIVRRRG